MGAARNLVSLRDRLTIGQSGLSVGPICLGMVKDHRLVFEAFERGINFFFVSADMHWPLYDGIRRGLAELFRARPAARDEIVVAAVSYVSDPTWLVQPFRELLEAVPGLGRLDVTVAGGVGPLREVERARFAALKRHRIAGATPLVPVRATGATFHHRPSAADALAADELDLVFIRYNTVHHGAERDVFPARAERRSTTLFNFKSTYGYVPRDRLPGLGFAGWQPTHADHYRFVMSQSAFDGMLCSPQTAAELTALEEALALGPLTADESRYLKSLTYAWLRSHQAPSVAMK